MKRYHGVSPLEQKRSMPAWLAKPSFVIGLLIVLVVILMALFPQFIAPYDPIATDVTVSNQAPSATHWFGTDFYGRDIFSRVIWGTRIDLLIGVLGVVIPFLVGGMIGLLAGYYGGFLDSLLMRITDIMMAFPLHHPGHHNHGHPGPGTDQPVHRPVAGGVDELRQAGAKRGAGAQGL